MSSMSPTAAYLILGAGALIWVTLCVWTVRRLWRAPGTPYERIVYRFGVRGFGVGFWILFAIVSALSHRGDEISPALTAAIMLFVGFPISLWAGYFWGRGMARFYGLAD